MRRPVLWLDVFTSMPLTGNQLAVVHDADGLADATMQAFARETRLSETTFVQTATKPGADYRTEIGRPSRLDCAWETDRPRVSGDVVVVADGHVRL